ncbi:hypothetical protein [Streptomyces sp. NPDC086519]|uniref:hypothetical protein n=1 Tax=Streptomyces sp. NPDC086519 TaxID=3154863 RepID=UPI003433D8A7
MHPALTGERWAHRVVADLGVAPSRRTGLAVVETAPGGAFGEITAKTAVSLRSRAGASAC